MKDYLKTMKTLAGNLATAGAAIPDRFTPSIINKDFKKIREIEVLTIIEVVVEEVIKVEAATRTWKW
ncbi:hypothetical protein Sjap_015421 [Stephania japonica]|uniref:Uncharacterized protein n=1 Tax=Stephania japonica TaxID=461633 RepID=A0AAP0IJ44_9MAGN